MQVLELAWDRLAAQSLEEELRRSAVRREARGKAAIGGASPDEVDVCDYPWVLLLDGTGPPRELLPSLRRGQPASALIDSGAALLSSAWCVPCM